MNAITFKVQSKNGGYVKTTVVPANHSAQSRFGPLDAAIVAVLLLGIGGLICLLVLK